MKHTDTPFPSAVLAADSFAAAAAPAPAAVARPARRAFRPRRFLAAAASLGAVA